MAVAPPRFTSPRPALPSTPWLGLRRAARRLRSFLEETPLRATTPLHTPAGPSNPPVEASCASPVGAPLVGAQRLAAGGRRGRSPGTPLHADPGASSAYLPGSHPGRLAASRFGLQRAARRAKSFLEKNSCAREGPVSRPICRRRASPGRRLPDRSKLEPRRRS